jgi:hypothetical protein
MIQPALGVNGYLTTSDPRPHFGLGASARAETVEILWPDGRRQAYRDIAANRILKAAPGDSKL